jgi:hypothetical protein
MVFFMFGQRLTDGAMIGLRRIMGCCKPRQLDLHHSQCHIFLVIYRRRLCQSELVLNSLVVAANNV